MVALLKDFVGRGPQNAQTFVFERLLVVLFEDTLTRAEQNLAERGQTRLVRDVRRGFADGMEKSLAALVEEQTGRQVNAVMNDYSVVPDYAISAFVLEAEPPATDGAESMISLGRSDDDAATAAQRRKIADGIVALFKEYVGRGPQQAWAYRHDDVIAVLLSDALTKAEQTLAAEGRASSVSEIRREFQAAMRKRMIELIETTVGRKVEALLSDHSVSTDHGIEFFVLAPEAAGSPDA